MNKRILAICDHCCHSGFARVAEQILGYLHRAGYEVHVLGINHLGEPHTRPYRVYPAQLFRGEDGRSRSGDLLGMRSLVPRIREIGPDVVFLFNDLQVLDGWMGRMVDEKVDLPVVTYFPVDSRPIHQRFAKRLKGAVVNVTYTEWGREVMRESCPDIEIEVIEHGVNTKVFRPQDRGTLRRLLGFPEDLYIVFRCDRNQPRKNWWATFRIFRRFMEGKSEARLMCHTVFRDVGGDLSDYAELLGFPPGVIWATSVSQGGKEMVWQDPMHGVTDETLARMYAVSDIFLTTTTGEGWGLAVTEAMACGLPVIGTDYSSLSEILGKGRGLPIKVRAWNTGKYGSDFAIVDEEAALKAMERAYRDRDYAGAIARQGMAYARSLDWETILPRWGEVFDRVTGGRGVGADRAVAAGAA